MKRFTIEIPEVTFRCVSVQAESPQEAIDKVYKVDYDPDDPNSGVTDEGYLDYTEDAPPGKYIWEVKDEDGKDVAALRETDPATGEKLREAKLFSVTE